MEENNIDNEDIIPRYRSVESVEPVHMRFLNLTDRVVEIIWINYSGKLVRYQLLRKHCGLDIDTYKTHPWLALDVLTKDRMLLNKKCTLLPEPLPAVIAEIENDNLLYPIVPNQRRRPVLITKPVYTLKKTIMLKLRNMFNSVDEVDSLNLQLPKSLLDDLKHYIEIKERLERLEISTAFTVS